jgi:hypothetical protein
MDLSQHELSPIIKVMLPKATGGYRAVTQLDPLDSIMFTAAVYEYANAIESSRQPRSDKVACSFRIDIKPDGQFFSDKTGWDDFHAKTEELVSSKKYAVVLCADIADFYTQASHHRIQNALSKAGVEEVRAKNIEGFLSRLNSLHHSRGVPIGPAAGILLAEACLADVDSALIRKGYVHTRYVDDFRLFCKDRHEAERALHDLSEYLFTAHRLSLQHGKTRILELSEFVAEELVDPEQLETENRRVQVAALVAKIRGRDYPDGNVGLDDDDLDDTSIDYAALRNLFMLAIDGSHLSVGIARYALRKAARLRTKIILNDLLLNIHLFVPVLRDAVNYLVKVCGSDGPRIGISLTALAQNSDFSFLPIVRFWIVDAFCRRPDMVSAETAFMIAETGPEGFRTRHSAQIAKAYGITDWVRERKETWQNHGPWDHRAILWASSVLPTDERTHWLKSAIRHPSLLTSSIAKMK